MSTLAYFDIFNYPLTEGEIWKWLYCPANQRAVDGVGRDIFEVKKNLEENEKLKSLISTDRGFYFFKNREGLAETREERYLLAFKKMKRAKRIANFLKFIPGVKMIALCNTLAFANAREESDIDFFIVAAPNKIWTARFWAAGFLQIFGLRPSKKNNKDKICLSFFVDTDSLNLESLSLGSPDIYLIYWVAQLVPLFDCSGIYHKFWQENSWIKNFLPNVFPRDAVDMMGEEIPSPGLPQKHASSGNLLGENFLRWLQVKMLPRSLKEMANRDSRVIITDKILKFHANDRREEYKKMWEEKISKLL